MNLSGVGVCMCIHVSCMCVYVCMYLCMCVYACASLCICEYVHSIATHTDVMDNPCYTPCKLNPSPPFSIAIKFFMYIVSVPQLFLCTSLCITDNEVQLATTQYLTELSVHTYSCWFMRLVNIGLPLCLGVFIKR